MNHVNKLAMTILTISTFQVHTLLADSTQARCDVYINGQDHASKMIPCIFSQRQGYITIARDDGVIHDLTPVGDVPGNFKDQNDRIVYRNSGLGDQGLIFRLPDESIYVYWNISRLNPDKYDPNNPTAPYTTAEYDATTLLRCGNIGVADFGSCPAGILRMEDRQASIAIMSPAGEEFTINFMKDYINATNREVKATLDGDTWTIIINDKEIYEVPIAAIEGG